jgi:hypothetical protein
MKTMAGSASRSKSLENLVGPRTLEEDSAAIAHAAYLFGLGYDRQAVSKAIVDLLYPNSNGDRPQNLKKTRQRIRNWESKQWFRDMVYDKAVIALDMSTPQILAGVKSKAKRGRVDAAKLALAITGRYQEKSSEIPSAVTINLVGIPRPATVVEANESDSIGLAEIVDEVDG